MSHSLSRRQALAGLATAAAYPLTAQSNRRPNVVVILVDDMGYADIGPYGAKDIRTPHLDRLAREGVRLTDHYSNGPVCTPTRAALMTGRWQQRVGLEWALVPADKGKGLPTSETSLARMLKGAGYRTALFGKWHLGMEPEYSPLRHGFDDFFGILSGNVDMYSHQYRSGLADLWEGESPTEKPGYLTELIASRASNWIDAHAREPFFAYVAFNAVHWPFQVPGKPESVRTMETWFDGTRAEYGRMLEAMDEGIGRVLTALERNGVANDTLVVFTNDNGGERLSDNAPLFHHKQTLWEGGIRVPAIARWPGRLPAGAVSRQAAITMDWTTTVLAATGVKAPEGRALDGIDLLPILSGKQPVRERTFGWRVNRTERKQKALRRGKWKLLQDGNMDLLFDLESDVGERRDVAFRHPELVAELRGELARWEAEVDRVPPKFVVR